MDLKSLKLNDLLNLDFGKLTSTELAYVEKRLSQTANRRIKRLKETKKIGQAKLTRSEKAGFKPYKAPKGYKPVSEGGNLLKKAGKRKSINVRNKRLQQATRIKEFLEKKTSKVKEIDAQMERYKDVIKKTTGYEKNITDRQAKRISRLMEKAREMGIGGEGNKKFSGSPKILQLIIDIVKSKDYVKNADAEIIIQDAINNGYESAQRLLNNLNEEDEDGDEFDYDDFFDDDEDL